MKQHTIQEKTKTDSNSAKPNTVTFVGLVFIVTLRYTCLSNWT